MFFMTIGAIKSTGEVPERALKMEIMTSGVHRSIYFAISDTFLVIIMGKQVDKMNVRVGKSIFETDKIIKKDSKKVI